MDLELAKTNLKYWIEKPAHEQHAALDAIIEAFRVFWNSGPTEQEFSEHTNGISLQPEMLYIMVKE